MLWTAVPAPGITGTIDSWSFRIGDSIVHRRQLPRIRVDSSSPIVVDDEDEVYGSITAVIATMELDGGSRYWLAFNLER